MCKVWRYAAFAMLCSAITTVPASAAPITVGQVDTFESETTEGWLINLLNQGGPPPAAALPVAVTTGGPGGAGDAYLRLTSLGGVGPGSRLVALNLAQWSGDYLAGGVESISMDVNNLGATDLHLRLLFENVGPTGPVHVAVSDSVFVPAGSGWQNVAFSINPSDLTALLGSIDTALSDATVLRIFHSPVAGFPPPVVAAQVGIDNITASADEVPEPASMLLFGTAALVAAARRRTR
jgi:hypothetical protein